MAIVDKQTECLRIVTIGYLKNFIGDLIKDSNGAVVHINTTAKTDYANDEYCPTYRELTGGTLIVNHIQGTYPADDVDGIVVNRIFYNDGVSNYTEDQEVNQKDLLVAYTTFNGFSIGANPTTISACGGNSTLSYSYGFTRNTKYMTSNCTITSSTQPISEAQDSNVTWTTSNFGSISYPTFSVGKNGSVSASSRTTVVTGKITFQGTEYSDTVTITQEALTGDYTSYEGRHYTGVTEYATTQTAFDCNGGDYAVRGTGYYFDRYNWVDSCGTEYTNVYKDTEGTEDAGTASGHFDEVICPSGTPENPINLEKHLTIEYHGHTDNSVTFTLSCNSKSCNCAAYDSQIVYTPQVVDCKNGSVVVPGQHTHYTPNGYDASGNCIFTQTVVDDSYTINYDCNPTSAVRDVDSTGRGNVTQAAGPCCCEGAMSVSSASCFDYNAHTNVIIGTYTILNPDVTNIHINNGDYPSWLTDVQLNTTNKTVSASMDAIPCETSGKEGVVIISFSINGQSCSVSLGVCQDGNTNLCECTAYTYSATCKVDRESTTSDCNIDLNLAEVPCNQMTAQLGLDVWRKCTGPHPDSDWSPYNDYSVVWSAPSGCFISLDNPTDQVLTARIPKNCTSSSRSCTITATCTVGGEVKTCSATITQQAGPCENCDCSVYTYSATCSNVVFNPCEGNGNVNFRLYRKCASPYVEDEYTEEWYDYTTATVTKSSASIDADFTFNGASGTYVSRVRNCDSVAKSLGTITVDFKSGSTVLASITANVSVAAGPCTACTCSAYSYSVTCATDTAVTVNGCSGSGTLSQPTVTKKCTNPDTPAVIYTDYPMRWNLASGDDFITFNKWNYTANDNCTGAARTSYYTAVLSGDSSYGEIGTCQYKFTQAAGTTCCECTAYTYSATCQGITVDECGGNGTINFKLYRKCTAPYPDSNWTEWYGYTNVVVTTNPASISDFTATFNGSSASYSYTGVNCNSTTSQFLVTFTFKDGQTTLTSVTPSVTIEAGPCVTCPCTEWEYRVTRCPNDVSNIDACGTVITEFAGETVQKRCAGRYSNPNEGWEAATRGTDYDIYFVGDNTFIDDVDDHTAWQAWQNCTSSSRQQQYTVSIVRVDNGNEIDSCQVTFSQLAGPCESCDCTNYSFRLVCPSAIDASSCDTSGSLLVPTVKYWCTSPSGSENDYSSFTYTYTKKSGAAAISINNSNHTWSIDKNCDSTAKSATLGLNVSVISGGTTVTALTCDVTFTQAAGPCSTCPCTSWLYDMEYCFDGVSGIQACPTNGMLDGMEIYKQCQNPLTDGWNIVDFSTGLTWSHQSGANFITISKSNGNYYWDASCNCDSARSEVIRFTFTPSDSNVSWVGNDYCDVTFSQVAGPCQACCGCQNYEYRFVYSQGAYDVENISECGDADDLPDLTVQYRCTTFGVEEWQPYTNFATTWTKVSGNATVNSSNGTWSVPENCTTSTAESVYNLTVVIHKLDGTNQTESAVTVRFKQKAGQCSSCSCSEVEYKIYCPSTTTYSSTECDSTIKYIDTPTIKWRCVSKGETWADAHDYEGAVSYVWTNTSGDADMLYIAQGNTFAVANNCTPSSRYSTWKVTAVITNDPNASWDSNVDYCNYRFDQTAGYCTGSCECPTVEYRVTGDSTYNISACGGVLYPNYGIQTRCATWSSQWEDYFGEATVTIVDRNTQAFGTIDNTNHRIRYDSSTNYNCSSSSRSYSYRINATVDGITATYKDFTVAQSAGPCISCPCSSWTWSVSGLEDIVLPACGACATEPCEFPVVVMRKCTNPSGQGDWVVYDDYNITWSFSTGDDYMWLNGTEYAPLESDNCLNRQLTGMYYYTITDETGGTIQSNSVVFTQDAWCSSGCNPCITATCETANFNVAGVDTLTKSSHSGVKVATYTSGSCVTSVTVDTSVTTGSWLTNITVKSDGTVTASTTSNSACESPSRTDSFKLIAHLSNGLSCTSDTISVTQAGNPLSCNPCAGMDCDDGVKSLFEETSESNGVVYSGSTAKLAQVVFNGDRGLTSNCVLIDLTGITSNVFWITNLYFGNENGTQYSSSRPPINLNDVYIWGTVAERDCSKLIGEPNPTEPRSGTVTFTYSVAATIPLMCTKTFTVWQNGRTVCSCSSCSNQLFAYDESSNSGVTIPATATTFSLPMVEIGNCISNISITSNANWVDDSTLGFESYMDARYYLTGDCTAQACGNSERSVTFTISGDYDDGYGNVSQCSFTMTRKQDALPICDCIGECNQNVVFTQRNSHTIAATGYTGTSLQISAGEVYSDFFSCIGQTGIHVVSSPSWVQGASFNITASTNTYAVTITGATAQQCGAPERNGVIRVVIGFEGHPCYYDFLVRQYAGSACPSPDCDCDQYTFTATTVPSSASTMMFFDGDGNTDAYVEWQKAVPNTATTCTPNFYLSETNSNPSSGLLDRSNSSVVLTSTTTSSSGTLYKGKAYIKLLPGTGFDTVDTGTTTILLRTGADTSACTQGDTGCCASFNAFRNSRTCNCSVVSASVRQTSGTTTNPLPPTSGTYRDIVIVSSTCPNNSNIRVSGGNTSWIASSSVTRDMSTRVLKLSITAQTNTTFDSRTAYFYLNVNGGSPCKEFSITQAAQVCNCSTSSFALSVGTSQSVGSGTTNGSITYTANCGSVSAYSTVNWITINHDASTKTVTYQVTENEVNSSRTGYIHFYLNGTLCKTVTFTQAAGCSCGLFTTTTGTTSGAPSSTITVFTISHPCGNANAVANLISAYGCSVSTDTTSHVTTIQVTIGDISHFTNADFPVKVGTLGYKLYKTLTTDETDCCYTSDLVDIYANAPSCACSNLVLGANSVVLTASTASVPYELVGCTGGTVTAQSSKPSCFGASVSNGNVVITSLTNNKSSATIQLYVNGTACSGKTIAVSKCGAITVSASQQVTSSGGQVTFSPSNPTC